MIQARWLIVLWGCTASLVYCALSGLGWEVTVFFARGCTASLLYLDPTGRSFNVNFFVKALKGRGILARGKAPRRQGDKIKPYRGAVI